MSGHDFTMLESLAREASTVAPESVNSDARFVLLPLWLLENIRDELGKRGIDWRADCRRYRHETRALEKATQP